MKKETLSQIISHIDEKYIDEATMFEKKSAKHTHGVKWGVIAACLVLFIGIGFAATAFVTEAREYKTAISFFEENGLSAEGLSRQEVKAVYRDITTKRFTYEKTAEVLRQVITGWEIEQKEPTPEDLAALWDRNVWMKSISQNGIDYRVDYEYVLDEKLGYEVLEKSVLECYGDGKKLWNAEFTDFYVEGHAYTKDVTTVWGSEIYSSSDTLYGWIAFVNNTGKVMWQQRLNHGFKIENVSSILKNADGTWAVISRGDLKYICLSCYDSDGKELSFHKTEVGNFSIRNTAQLGDGYILQLWNQSSGDTALLYKMNREGTLTDSFSYETDNCDYYITDMVEFEGNVYLSAYAVPKQRDEGGRHEIANVLDYVFSKGAGEVYITSEELTPIVRDNYTALLLMCNPEGGAPKTFYSVKGSMGGKLSVNKTGILEWNVESIVTTFFSPSTSSFTIGGTCKVFKYTFDKTGDLTGQTDTGKTVPYGR